MGTDKKDIFLALVISGTIGIIVYGVVRTTLFFYSAYSGVEKIFALMLVSGELFVLMHGLGYALNIIQALTRPEVAEGAGISQKGEPWVAILVAARHEPREVLESTFITINNIRYKNKNVYFLDDSSEPRYKREAEELAEQYGLRLFRRDKRRGAKAGIINDCVKTLTEQYISIFDADQNPMPEFLNALVPMLEADEKLAFIQTPQFYTNIDESRVARGAAFQQTVFYEYICEGKSSNDSMFCCGTNVIFRRKALEDVGGLDESTVTEDFATSVKLHTKGWRSFYYSHVCVFGMGPENLTGYFRQQFRWAVGTISVLKIVMWQFMTRPLSLSMSQWWEYFISSSYYLIGLAFFFLMICPMAYLLFRIPSFFALKEVYFTAFIPYIILSLGVFYIVLKDRHYRPRDLFLGQLLGAVTITVYMRAALSAIIGVKTDFGITGKNKGSATSYALLWPQLLLVFLNFVAIVWGLNRYFYEGETAIIINCFWAFYNFIMLSAIFYFNEGR